MKKSMMTHLIILVVTIVAGWLLASHLRAVQIDTDPTKNQIRESGLLSIAGVDKLISEINWMLYIYYRGGEKSVNDDNKQELYDRIDEIISANPNLEIAYTMGASGLYPIATDKAVKLLKRGCEAPHLKKSWKIPYLIAFYESQNFFKEIPEDVMRDSLQYYEIAMTRNGGKNHFIASGYYRTKAKLLPEKDKNYALLEVLLDEWKVSRNAIETGTDHQDIQKRLLKACKDAISYEEEPATQRTLKFIERIRKTVLADEHLCASCITKYNAGDKFCKECGKQVEVYGVCVKCKHVLNGKFCSDCGTKATK